jgi:glycosyltransferase involved in cell wall biosynthesis
VVTRLSEFPNRMKAEEESVAPPAIASQDRSSATEKALTLLIAIPALNEEQSISSIIRRSLDAKKTITENSPVTRVEICVVSDGSTDRTVDIARSFGDAIGLIIFERNQGYGAAIKAAWRQSDAELLGFLDADGTCDPRFFATLCSTIEQCQADVVLGCRMTAESKMPLLRRIGNVIFALLLSFFSSKRVRDTASGMRVVRRSSLSRLLPLPDGMHFTPAMSARAILSPDLSILEREMPYHERAGRSKLRVFRDGLRFLGVITEAALLYRPGRPLLVFGLVLIACAALLLVNPALYWIENRRVLEWMIYRFVVAHLLTTSGVLFIVAAHLASRVVQIVLQIPEATVGVVLAASRFFSTWRSVVVALLLVLAGGALVIPGLLQLVTTGEVYEHWSRFIAMSVCLSTAGILIVARLIELTLSLLSDRIAFLRTLDSSGF